MPNTALLFIPGPERSVAFPDRPYSRTKLYTTNFLARQTSARQWSEKLEAESAMGIGFEDLGDLAINAIISKLDAKDAVAVSCVSKKLRVSASEESLWINLCSKDLGLSAPIDPLGNPTSSFKVGSLFF